MSDHDALLRAITEQPAEDTPRLIFADWLDEHADALPAPAAVRQRAAFIRDDVAMSQRDELDPLRLRWEWIEKPQREAERWVTTLLPPALWNSAAPDFIFRRGFPWHISLTPGQFLATAEEFLHQVPAGTLSFSSSDVPAEAVFRSPQFARITGLHVEQVHLRPPAIAVLADSPQAAGLEELRVGRHGLEASAVRTLFQSGLFRRLTRLELNGSPALGSYLVNDFRHARSPRLRELSLAASELSGRHVEHVLTAPAAANLTRLSLANCRLGLAGFEGLVRADLPHLRDLQLGTTTPGPESIRLLSSSATLVRLQMLGFRANHVNRALMTELANCPPVTNLRVLDLSSNPIGNDGAVAIARSPYLAGLLVLDLSYSQVGDEGILAILESPLADGLVLLDLRGSPASAETKEVLKAKMGDRVRI